MTIVDPKDELAFSKHYDFYIIENEVLDMGLGITALAVYNVLMRFAFDGLGGKVAFPSLDKLGAILAESPDDPNGTPTPVSRPTLIKALKKLEQAGLISITKRKSADGKQASNLYRLLDIPKGRRVKHNYTASKKGIRRVKQLYRFKTPESELKKKKEEAANDPISAESRAFWDMFTKRHQAVFNRPYNGPAVEMDTHPTLRTLQALDAAERFEIVDKGLKAMAGSGQLGTVGSWDLYETEIQRAIDDYAAQRKANQVIAMFTANLNEALVRCHLPVMTGTYTDKQRQEIAMWGSMLDANDLEQAILLYPETHPNDKQPFMINVKLNWVITAAQRNKQATASGAVPAARNGNGNGTHTSYRNGAAGNRGSSRGQASSQPAIDWDAAYERVEALYK